MWFFLNLNINSTIYTKIQSKVRIFLSASTSEKWWHAVKANKMTLCVTKSLFNDFLWKSGMHFIKINHLRAIKS